MLLTNFMSKDTIEVNIDERGVRALSAAVNFTLEKWAGQGDMDQEMLILLKSFLQGCIFEFDFHRKVD